MRIGIIGATGAVGKELIQLLEKSNLFPTELRTFDSKTPPDFQGLGLLFCCAKSEVAKALLPKAASAGVICIDASSAFRLEKEVPLVIPEINGHALQNHQGIIASPNCTTTIMLLPLAPLHRQFQIKRVVAATYQAVSGAGTRGIEELERQTQGHSPKEVFPHPCAFNTFLHESHLEEETKMSKETKKILEDPTVEVTARCVRVPVFRAHSEALNVEFKHPFSLEEMQTLLSKVPGILHKESPTAIDATHHHSVFYGNLRLDHTQPKTIEMWVVGDQLLKGAALNMVQIAEAL